MYAEVRVQIPQDFFSYERFVGFCYQLNMDASPGLPFCYHHPTIAELLEWDGETLSDVAMRTVYEYMLRAIETDLNVPFRVFLKDEPLTQAKAKVGRWRMIFASSIVHQLLDHMLFSYQDTKKMERMWSVPPKIGWAPFFGNPEVARKVFSNPVSMDKTAWDWTVSSWVVDALRRLRHRTAVAPELWHVLVDWRYDRIYNCAVFQFSDGEMYQQTQPGLMKSGVVTTLSDNSDGQVIVHDIALARLGYDFIDPFWSLGDDVLCDLPPGLDVERLRESYLELGVVLKEAAPGWKFGGFDLWTKQPEYWSKHVTNLLYTERLKETLISYQYMYAFSPKLEVIQKVLMELDPSAVRSREYLRAWADRV